MMNICSRFDVFCNIAAYNVNMDCDGALLASILSTNTFSSFLLYVMDSSCSYNSYLSTDNVTVACAAKKFTTVTKSHPHMS